jgi:hypothetical protein
MRSFFGTHWKAIVTLLILIVVAVLTMSPGAASPSLAARLRAHVEAIAAADEAARPGSAARHIEAALGEDGYRLRRETWPSGERAIEASLANPAPGTHAGRVFIIGANGANGSGAAAVLELAHLLRHLRPSPGTELRFVFFVNQRKEPAAGLPQSARPGQVEDPENRYPDTGNFIAFVGPPVASRLVRETLSAFRAVSDFPAEGLAAPAFVQGVITAGRAPCQRCDQRSLVISDSAFLGYPYYRTGDLGAELDYDAIARVVNGLARTLGVLAEGQRG